MLAGARLRDDPRLPHAQGQEHLAHAIIDHMGTGMIEFIALKINLRATEMVGQTLSEI